MLNNVRRLKTIIIKLLKADIKEISLIDLQNLIMLDCCISKKDTVKWYVEICINNKWISQGKKGKDDNFYFDIIYKYENGELF